MSSKVTKCYDFFKTKLRRSKHITTNVTARGNERSSSSQAAPVHFALESQLKMSSPVCPETDVDMDTLLEKDSIAVSQLKRKMTRARIARYEPMLQDSHWRYVFDFSASELKPEDPNMKQEILLSLWENILKYSVYFDHVRRNEEYWAGGQGRPRRRKVTYEKEAAALHRDYMQPTLCEIKKYAENNDVELPRGFIHDEIDSIEYSEPESKLRSDCKFYVILNSFETDFLPFARTFFASDD